MHREFIIPGILGIIVAVFISFMLVIPFFEKLDRSHPLSIGMMILSIIAIPFLLRKLIKIANN